MGRIKEYSYERMSYEKLNDFFELFETRGKSYTLDYFKTKYNTKWLGKEYIGVIVYDNKKAIGHIGSLPVYSTFNNTKYLCSQLCDIVVHPNYRKKGIFQNALKKIIEIAKKEKVNFLYVFPNNNAYKGFLKANWYKASGINSYTVKTKTIPLNKIANKLHIVKFYDAYIRFVLRFFFKQKEILSFDNSSIENNIGGIINEKGVFNQKKNSLNYIINYYGFKIWWKIDDGFSIGDIERLPQKNFDELMEALNKLCFYLGFHNFKVITSENNFLDNMFRQRYKSTKGVGTFFFDIDSKLDFKSFKFTQSNFNTF